MPRNGLGTYYLPAGQPVVSGSTISSTTFNTLTSDLSTALTQSLCIDGQAVPTANLGMGGFKITNAAAGSATTDVATLQNFASPPSIGSTTPGVITASTLTASSLRVGGSELSTVNLGVYDAGIAFLRVTGDANSVVASRAFSNTPSNAPWFYCTKGGGTLASPAAVGAADSIGGIRWFGRYNASTDAETARIAVTSESAWSSTTVAPSVMSFFTNPSGIGLTEAMRLTAAGNLYVSNTTGAVGSGNTTVTGSAFSTNGVVKVAASAQPPLELNRITSTGPVLNLYTQGVLQGWVTAGSLAVSLVNASDYRLKHDVKPLPSMVDKVMALNPVSYKWNQLPDVTAKGFIAHELAEVCPEAVFGIKDAVKDDGSIDPQGVDPSKLIPMLVKAIQEQQATMANLQARLVALEAV